MNLQAYLLFCSCKYTGIYRRFYAYLLIGNVGLKFVGTGSMVIILITQGKPTDITT